MSKDNLRGIRTVKQTETQTGTQVETGMEPQMETSSLVAELAEADARIDDLKEAIAMGEATSALLDDSNYQKVFVDGFFDGEEKRIAGVLTTPNTFEHGQLEIFMEKLASIRHAKEWIRVCMINYTMALEQLPEEEEYRKQITARHTQG